MGQEITNPTLGSNLTNWRRNNANSVLFLATNGGATTVVRRHEGKTPGGDLGDGQEAWEAPEEKYDAASNATRQDLHVELGKAIFNIDARGVCRFVSLFSSLQGPQVQAGGH